MRLYDEIFKNTDGMPLSRCTVIPCGGGYFEGVKAVGDFSSERVVICFPRVTMAAEGKNLSIKKYYDGDLQIGGKVACVKVVLPGENGGIK
jgi:hypothetical protein